MCYYGVKWCNKGFYYKSIANCGAFGFNRESKFHFLLRNKWVILKHDHEPDCTLPEVPSPTGDPSEPPSQPPTGPPPPPPTGPILDLCPKEEPRSEVETLICAEKTELYVCLFCRANVMLWFITKI